MYSRYSNRPRPSVQIPEHYSGVAFSGSTSDESPVRYLEVAKPSPHAWEEPPAHKEPPPAEPPHDDKPRAPAAPPVPVPLLPPPHKARTPFSGGLDFDQLLILGLILLLWGNERDGDVIMWLGLLLLWS